MKGLVICISSDQATPSFLDATKGSNVTLLDPSVLVRAQELGVSLDYLVDLEIDSNDKDPANTYRVFFSNLCEGKIPNRTRSQELARDRRNVLNLVALVAASGR